MDLDLDFGDVLALVNAAGVIHRTLVTNEAIRNNWTPQQSAQIDQAWRGAEARADRLDRDAERELEGGDA